MPKGSYNKSALGIGMPRSQVNFEWVIFWAGVSALIIMSSHLYYGKEPIFFLVHRQGYRNLIFVKYKF